MTLEQQLETGITHHRAGRLAEAEAIYRQILALDPSDADVLHLLGIITKQTGRDEEAIDLIGRAIALDPDYAEAHFNLGVALADRGQLDRAISSYEKAIQLTPEYVEAQFNLGDALLKIGRLDAAISSLERAVQLKPDYAKAYNSLGNALAKTGRRDEAIAAYRHAVELKGDFAEAHNNIGTPLQETGSLDEAIAAYRRAIQLKPDFAEAYSNLGNVLSQLGKYDDAIASYRQAIALKPDAAESNSNLGNALKERGRLDDAIAAYGQAIRLKPDYAEAYSNLGTALAAKGQLTDAIAAYRQAIGLKPDYAEAYSNLGKASKDLGQLDEAIASYRQALLLKPDLAEAHSNLLFTLNYHPDRSAEEILAEHRAWSDEHARTLMNDIIPHANQRSPERRLRIGYVSADFFRHSVAYFFIPLLEQHDPRNVEVFCYANLKSPDDLTERIKRSCGAWRNILGLADEAVAKLVRSDGIDILVDLSGHTAGNRLRVFARRPAPIQVTYLGYANTTGMTAIDYRFTDALADPPGTADELNVEKLWRLPTCAWCYQPSEDAPDVQPRGDQPITFGCFNAFAKINPKMVAIWAELLKRVPGSQLLLKSAAAGEASARQRLTGQFAEHGIPEQRIEMLGRLNSLRGHLELYHRVDVALDTYPYHGTTTICEALWMGVPVVSLAGRTHASRVGVSLLSNAGLPELIAQTPEEYLSIASKLAANPSRMDALRAGLRDQMRSSPLVDGARFAAEVEAAYRQMWREWCAESGKLQPEIRMNEDRS